MTINDMIEQGIEFQGKIEVRRWREKTTDNIIYYANDNGIIGAITAEYFNEEVESMWCMDNTLIIELVHEE